jgi:hypothetical protein
METMVYALRYEDFVGTLLMRGVLSPGGHVAWAAMYGAALAMIKGSQRFHMKHFTDKGFLIYFGMAFALHFLWNYPIFLLSIPLFGDLKFILLTIAAWIALMNMIKKGIQQVLSISQAPALRNNNAALAVASALRGGSGTYKDCLFPLSGGVLIFGRDGKRANIVFPSSTPGISSVHCEVRNEGGKIVLVDRGSSYGTFLSNGAKLLPNQPYVLNVGDKFYLANRDNQFEIM